MDDTTPNREPIGVQKAIILVNGEEINVIEPYYHPSEIIKAKEKVIMKAIEILKRRSQERGNN